MPLTTAQQTALKNDVLADPTLSQLTGSSDGRQTIADAYNADASPAFKVFRTDVPVTDLFNQILWANYTPQDAIPTDTVLNTSIWQTRSLDCQGKQFNLQTMLSGRTTFDASKINQRAGLNDATTSLPSGASGASKSGGWSAILPVLYRNAKRVEKLFAVATTGVGTDGIPGNLGTTTNPALMAFEGALSQTDVQNALNQG